MSLEHSTNVIMNSQDNTSDWNNEEDLLMSGTIFFIFTVVYFVLIEQLLDLDIPSKPKQSTNDNDSSDDMFGSDDDLLQALEHDPSWSIVNEPNNGHHTQTQPDSEIEIAEHLDSLNNSVENINAYMSNLDIIKNDSPQTFPASQSITEQEITPFIWEDTSTDDVSTDICSQKLQLETSVPSTATPSSSIPTRSSRPGISLRKRNAIQLQPFTLENAQFKKLIGGVSTKSKLKDAVNIKLTPDDNDMDTDFTPFDTQLVDEPMDEISVYELESLGVYRNKPKPDKKLQKKNSLVPPAPKTIASSSSRAQKKDTPMEPPSTSAASSSSSIPERTHPPSTESFSNNLTNIEYPKELQKYGLSKLILPPTNKHKAKKAITFTTKRKSSKRKERSTLSRNVELPNTDIFAFDFDPKAIPRHVPTIDSSIPVDPDNESDEEVVFRRPRLKKRKVLISDSEEEEEVESMTEEQLNRIFAFPTEPLEPQHIKRYGVETGNSSTSSNMPIVDDGFEYRDQKRQRMDIRDLQAKSLKNVLPASYLKLNQKKLEEELRNRRLAKNTRSSATSSTAVPKKDSSRISRNAEDIFAAFREDTDDEVDNNNSIDRHIQGSTVNTNNCDDTIRIDNSESIYYDDHDDYGFISDHGIGTDDDDCSMNGYSDNINYDRDAITDRREIVNYGYDNENVFGIDDRMEYDYDDNNGMDYENTTSRHGIIDHADRVDNRSRIDRYLIPEYRNSASTSSITRIDTPALNPTYQNTSIPNTSVDQSQAIEFNRISRQSIQSTRNGYNIQPTGTSRRPIEKSSATNAKPTNRDTGRTKSTSTTTTKRKKRPRRTMDDIYVHKPYFISSISNRGSGRANEAGNQSNRHSRGNETRENHRTSNVNNNENVFRSDDLPRKAFDDIYMNTKRQSKYYRDDGIYIGNYDISDYLKGDVVHKDLINRAVPIYSLDEVIKQVRNLKNPDIRGVIGLQDTVYIHRQLIVPLISKNPKEKRIYPQFKETHSDLMLFGKRYYWKQINSKGTHIIKDLFAKVFQDILYLCRNDKIPVVDEFGDLPDHEYFYIFISLCLTQWIPILPVKEQSELILLLTYHIRNLTYSLTKLAEIRHHEKIRWRPIVKLLLYLLDWTCRLELLNIDRTIWSVIEFSQTMMDVLVYIGYERVKKEKNQYLIEAWICLILIMSVSNRKHGYHLNETIFLNQITSSIQRKSRKLANYEYKKRRTIKYWAETLDYILNKHTIF
ncbi:hypothetical protein BDF21DRAFT_432726 [Thamnidium elegans]|nr:hypothetical protein BDF21DRAFT_432726 [Thamnidium elegans]